MSIQIPQGCKPSEACAKDPTRPSLMHAVLRNRPDGLWLLASDSYIAVALKVEGKAKDGWLPVDVLKIMERDARRRTLVFEQLSETSWRVIDGGVTTTYEYEAELRHCAFPKLEEVGNGVLFGGGTLDSKATPFGFNPELLGRVGKALGGGGVRTEVYGPLKPIRLTALGYPDRIAIQMPVRLFESAEYRAAA